ncbi:MAG: hypothetical protein HYS56_02445 [Candidatus Omnitrophica bacterium]|nr:hypothetical protein [Candidatus Omnitrophota bacterium]
MQKAEYLFLLRHFNDIDQIIPVVWKMNESGCSVGVILVNDNYSVQSDYRLRFLLSKSVPVATYVDLLKNERRISDSLARLMRWSKSDFSVVKTIFRKAFYTPGKAAWVLEQTGCRVCIFEWNNPLAQLHGDFFTAAKGKGIRTVCLPHGLNIYLNPDVTVKERATGKRPDFSQRTSPNGFDHYVVQSEYHRRYMCECGADPGKTLALGSARYSPEWQKVNSGLVPDYGDPFQQKQKKKVVFMLPQWNYNVNRPATIQLLSRLMEREDINLVIRGHTRGGQNSLGGDFGEKRRRRGNVRLESEISSVALIRWADVVINFASSIGFEVLLQNKVLLSPEYLHTNRTIFAETKACVIAHDEEETLRLLDKNILELRKSYTDREIQNIFKTVIFGGRETSDILMNYVHLLTGGKPVLAAQDVI